MLLYADQGLGDTLQFVRYAPMVAARGARVILQVQKPLVGLLGGVRGVDQVVARGDPLPAFDLRCALASLPLACKTRVDTIPTEIPYLPVPPDHVEKWRARLPASGRLKVGLHWAGNAKYAKDDQRSILLSPLLPLLAASDATFFSLQNELREGDRELLQATPDIQHLGDDITPFEDAAAVVSLMDLIIASDTAIVHLAGALGKPVWVPLPFVPDWRWLRDREDSPWYPTVRLFRQPSAGDWTSVVERVGRELSSWHPN